MSKLAIYNAALRIIKQTALASLTENRAPRRALDAVWDGEPTAIDYTLSQGLWNFAMRGMQLEQRSDLTTAFGYTYAFAKPSDSLRLNKVCVDETLRTPLTDYQEEMGVILANVPTVYVQYVSNDAAYGSNMTLWPPLFKKFLAAYLASEVAGEVTGDDNLEKKALNLMAAHRNDARSKDALEQAPSFLPERGTFRQARAGGRSTFNGNNNGGVY